ncbi:class I SAM-dependent methyltransferase [Candidatus Curtissbacteria bacterium]|nr:class I SAM-dependent methyltransferase [Candidatus Curtissbacteria bacterium]
MKPNGKQINYSIEFLSSAAKEFRKLKNVRAGSAENTKFGNSNFDLVVLLDVLEHTDDKKTLIEINRILKKEGLLVISVPAYGWMWSKWDVNLHHRRRYTKPSLAKVLKGAHFQILEISYFNSFLVLPVYIIRKIKTVLAPSEYGSDFRIGSPFVNNILMKLSDLERRLVIKSGIPFGLSIIVVAKKVD